VFGNISATGLKLNNDLLKLNKLDLTGTSLEGKQIINAYSKYKTVIVEVKE